MLKPPKSMCNQSIIIRRKVKDDLYGEATYDDGVDINNCVVHLRTVYSGTNNNRQIVANGTVMIYKDISEPLIPLSKQDIEDKAKIIYEGQEYTLTNINEDYEPFSKEIYQYKLTMI